MASSSAVPGWYTATSPADTADNDESVNDGDNDAEPPLQFTSCALLACFVASLDAAAPLDDELRRVRFLLRFLPPLLLPTL